MGTDIAQICNSCIAMAMVELFKQALDYIVIVKPMIDDAAGDHRLNPIVNSEIHMCRAVSINSNDNGLLHNNKINDTNKHIVTCRPILYSTG